MMALQPNQKSKTHVRQRIGKLLPTLCNPRQTLVENGMPRAVGNSRYSCIDLTPEVNRAFSAGGFEFF
jgi:hypothetical protein